MLKMVDGTGIIGVDMICPLGVSTPQPPNYDRVELEGAGMLVLPNSLDAPLERLELGGKTEQVQTTGKNLFGGKILAGKYPTDDMNIYEDKTTTNIFDKPVEIKPDTEYIISADGRLVEGNIYIYNEAGKKITEHYSGKFTSPSNAKYVVASGSNTYMTVNSAVQIEYGSTISSYEPYTGGKPSPSPEYPQEIKSVGKWNEEKQKYEVDVKVSNCGYLQKGSYADKIRPLPLEKGKTYRIYVDVKSAVVNVGILNEERTFANSGQLYVYYNSRGYPISSTGVVSGICRLPNSLYRGYTFTVTVDGLFLYQGVNANILNTDNAYVAYDFIKKVDISSPYTEKESVVLTSDRPLTKWDRLVEQDGQIGWLYQSNTVVIDGSETWSSSNVPDHIYFTTTVNNKSGRINTSLCKTYKNNGEPVFNKKHEGEYNIYSDHPTNGVSDTAFVPPNETVTTIPQWKEWLNANPIEMLYKTKTTEFIPLPQSEQNAIRALKAYHPTTVITADGGELDPDIKVTYRKEK